MLSSLTEGSVRQACQSQQHTMSKKRLSAGRGRVQRKWVQPENVMFTQSLARSCLSGKIRQNTAKSGKIRQTPAKSVKIRLFPNPAMSVTFRQSPSKSGKSGKIRHSPNFFQNSTLETVFRLFPFLVTDNVLDINFLGHFEAQRVVFESFLTLSLRARLLKKNNFSLENCNLA